MSKSKKQKGDDDEGYDEIVMAAMTIALTTYGISVLGVSQARAYTCARQVVEDSLGQFWGVPYGLLPFPHEKILSHYEQLIDLEDDVPLN